MSDDLNGSLRLDLPKGSAEVRGEPVVVLPAQALETLLRSSPAASRIDMGRDVGTAMGRRMADRLGGSNAVRSASTEAVVNAFAAEIALAGLGEVSLERWGRAMVIGVSGGPLAKQTELLGGLIGGAIGTATGTQAAAVSIGEGKYFVGTTRACDRLRDLLTSGTSFGDAIGRMQGAKA